jgi:hypothetical protein
MAHIDEHIYQPERSNTCGQTCVAMIAGVTYAESVTRFRSRAATRTKQVSAVLRGYGFACPGKLERYKGGELPKLCIVKLTIKRNGKKWGHWVVYDDGYFFDPSLGVLLSYNQFPESAITSFMPVTQEDNNHGNHPRTDTRADT